MGGFQVPDSLTTGGIKRIHLSCPKAYLILLRGEKGLMNFVYQLVDFMALVTCRAGLA